jgi:penicillin-binding protein 1C
MFFGKLKIHLLSHKLFYFVLFAGLLLYYFSLPRHLFRNDYSTVVLGSEGELIGARIARDGQWRFPHDSIVPDKFKQCIVYFEDRYFRFHPGFNPVSLVHATYQNLKARKVVSGGSTLSMQVIRLHREGRSRTVVEKIIEIVLATRLELRYSKNEILGLYASHAPYGGNVVGIQAAAWRYFGRSTQNLSWAEAALLAVLPNSPAMIHPGRNRDNLLEKRNKLLSKLYKNNVITLETFRLSLLEPLPLKPLTLPDIAPHYTENMRKAFAGQTVKSAVRKGLQENLNRIVLDYHKQIQLNEINNACVLVIEVKTGNIVAYVGNIPTDDGAVDGQDVDCIQAPRSTGSILKPLLFLAMQQEGLILPGTLVPDIPTRIAGFKPENYDLGYDGAVPAKRALSRSLNIPTVRLLQTYGIPKFQNLLQRLGMTTLTYSPDHYGLTLIVGGAEGKLLEISKIYAGLSRQLVSSTISKSVNIHDSSLGKDQIDPGAIWLTFSALLEVNRPDEESGWKDLSSSRKIAWKTGTSYGFRDAWAIGTTPEYVVGVWVGNADGEGRPGLTGVGAAAPLMFRVFNSLPSTSWFHIPYDDLDRMVVCRQSGFKAGPYCDEKDTIFAARAGVKTALCPFHVLVHLSPDGKFRVQSKCESVENMVHKHWFVLPPAMEWYYRKKNFFYRQLPPMKAGCMEDDVASMELIYPTEVLKIFVPREIDGSPGKTIFEVAHRNPEAILYWHVDDQFLGTTKVIHQWAFAPTPGKHRLTIVDDKGRSLTRNFEVVDSR